MTTRETHNQTTERLSGRAWLGTVTVIAGSVAVFATNNYVTASLLPSVMSDIGGQRYYAWTATTFLVASTFATLLVGRMLNRFGTRGAILFGLTMFAAGSAMCAVSPSVWALLAGRSVQGFGGGLMSGVALAAMRMVLPQALWSAMLAVISLMWALGNLAGPALGGVFAQIHQWRAGFAMMVVAALLIAVLAVRSLPASRGAEAAEPWPAGSLVLATAGTTAVSFAAVVPKGLPTVGLIAVGALLAAGFLRHERRSARRILPTLTYRSASPLRWYYLGVAGLTLGLTAETFVPLFGQRLAGLSPLAAGFLGAAISLGWSVAQLVTTRITGPVATRRLRVIGPTLVATGLALTAALQTDDASYVRVALWVVTMLLTGAGIGMGFTHFAFPIMSGGGVDDGDATKAAAGISIVQVMGSAFGSAFGGVLVNLGEPSMLHAARLLYGGLGALALIGVFGGLRSRGPITEIIDADPPGNRTSSGSIKTSAPG